MSEPIKIDINNMDDEIKAFSDKMKEKGIPHILIANTGKGTMKITVMNMNEVYGNMKNEMLRIEHIMKKEIEKNAKKD